MVAFAYIMHKHLEYYTGGLSFLRDSEILQLYIVVVKITKENLTTSLTVPGRIFICLVDSSRGQIYGK